MTQQPLYAVVVLFCIAGRIFKELFQCGVYMVNTVNLAKKYQALEKSIATKRAALVIGSNRASQMLDKLRECIRLGESTGDIAEDLMYLQKGSPDPQVAECYRAIQLKIAGKTGTLVVVAVSTRGAYDDSFESPTIDHGITQIYAGVLTGDKLVVEKENGMGFLQTKERLYYSRHLQRIDDCPIRVHAPRDHPWHISGVELFMGKEIEELYRKHYGFRNFVLEKSSENTLKHFSGLPVPELVLT